MRSSQSENLIVAYQAKRAARGKPVVVTYNGNGTYTIKSRANLVPYVVSAAQLKTMLSI